MNEKEYVSSDAPPLDFSFKKIKNLEGKLRSYPRHKIHSAKTGWEIEPSWWGRQAPPFKAKQRRRSLIIDKREINNRKKARA